MTTTCMFPTSIASKPSLHLQQASSYLTAPTLLNQSPLSPLEPAFVYKPQSGASTFLPSPSLNFSSTDQLAWHSTNLGHYQHALCIAPSPFFTVYMCLHIFKKKIKANKQTNKQKVPVHRCTFNQDPTDFFNFVSSSLVSDPNPLPSTLVPFHPLPNSM